MGINTPVGSEGLEQPQSSPRKSIRRHGSALQDRWLAEVRDADDGVFTGATHLQLDRRYAVKQRVGYQL